MGCLCVKIDERPADFVTFREWGVSPRCVPLVCGVIYGVIMPLRETFFKKLLHRSTFFCNFAARKEIINR